MLVERIKNFWSALQGIVMTPCVFVIVIVHLQMVGGEQCIIGMGIMLITSHHEGEADGSDTQNKTSQKTHFIKTSTRWIPVIVMGRVASLYFIYILPTQGQELLEVFMD